MTSHPATWALGDLFEMMRLKPDMTPEEIGEANVDRMDDTQVRVFAIRHIAEQVRMIRRDEAHRVEQAAERPVEQPQPRVSPYQQFERWLADPVKHWHLPNQKARVAFKQWAGDRFPAWHAAARQAAEAAQETTKYAIELFEGDWYPAGPAAYDRKRRNDRVREDMYAAVAAVAHEVRLETTRELLGAFFALGDGRQVTWGEATVAEHRQRIALLVGNAAGAVETAARHQAAIRMIEEAGVSRLGDLSDSLGRAA